MAEKPNPKFPPAPPKVLKRVKRTRVHSRAELMEMRPRVEDRRTGERRSGVDRRKLEPDAHQWQDQGNGMFTSGRREWKPDRRQADRRVGKRDRRRKMDMRGTWTPDDYGELYAPDTSNPGVQLVAADQSAPAALAVSAASQVETDSVSGAAASTTPVVGAEAEQAESAPAGPKVTIGLLHNVKPDSGVVRNANGEPPEPEDKSSNEWLEWARTVLAMYQDDEPRYQERIDLMFQGHPKMFGLKKGQKGYDSQIKSLLASKPNITAAPTPSEAATAEKVTEKGEPQQPKKGWAAGMPRLRPRTENN